MVRSYKEGKMALLSGKTAVITGSTQGIGRGIALELAREGAQLVLNHRAGSNRHAVQETLRAFQEMTGEAPPVCEADMTSETDVIRLANTARQVLGRVDIWVNNVGIHRVTPALEQSLESWEGYFRINTSSAFLGCREAARIMAPAGGGSIINIASKMGIAGSANNACYCATKAAVIMLTRCLAAEWAGLGIRVNVIAPGVTNTGPTKVLVEGNPALEAALKYRIPLGRFAEPEEIGKAAVFLACQLSSYVTGAVLACDGGWTAHSDFAGIPPEKLAPGAYK
jgi:2-dehydro-3-deoxy-D-gluconate 5-dehydrogenase